jgi:hypothetical protein
MTDREREAAEEIAVLALVHRTHGMPEKIAAIIRRVVSEPLEQEIERLRKILLEEGYERTARIRGAFRHRGDLQRGDTRKGHSD